MRFLGNKSTFTKMILSYIAVLVIPLAFGISLYCTTVNIYKKDVDKANLQVLNNVRDNVHLNLSGMNNMMRALINDNSVISLASKSSYTNTDYTAMSNLQSQISMSLITNSYIDEVLIYFHNSDFLLTSKSYLKSVNHMSNYSNTIGLNVADFTKQLKKRESSYLKLFPTEQGTRAFVVTCDRITSSPGITILTRIKPGTLSKIMTSEHCQTFMVDDCGHSLSAEGKNAISGKKGSWKVENMSSSQCIETEDLLFHVSYVRFIPTEIYSLGMTVLQRLAVIFLFLTLAVGIVLALSIAKKSYNPIQEILSLITCSGGSDDYKAISTSITDLLQKNEAHKLELDAYCRSMRNYLLFQLLTTPNMEEKTFLCECHRCGQNFDNTSFALLGFRIENDSSFFLAMGENTEDQNAQVLIAAINNILRETMGPEYPFFTAQYRDGYYALINIDARLDKDVVIDEIKNNCRILTSRLDTNFRAIVSVAISNVHSSYKKVRRCYDEIKEIFRQQENGKKVAYVVQYHELDAKLDPTRSPDTEGNAKKEPEKHSSVQDICSYIDQNYSDPDLSVGALSEYFHMTTANLSLYFKRKIGLSPLEYIQLKRVSESKRLIDSTNLRISDIANQVGYYDSRPLIRSFKRIEGLTPAEYRDRPRLDA